MCFFPQKKKLSFSYSVIEFNRNEWWMEWKKPIKDYPTGFFTSIKTFFFISQFGLKVYL